MEMPTPIYSLVPEGGPPLAGARGARAVASATLAIVRRDWQVFISYRLRFITQWLSAFFTLTLFYYISRLVRIDSFASPDDYYAFVVVGLIILQVLSSTLYNPPIAVQGELRAGTFERFVVSPFGPVASLCSTLVFPFVYSLVNGVVMLGFAWIVFGLPVEWSTAAVALPVAILGSLAFASFGVALLGVVLVAKQAVAGTNWIIALLSLVAGLYFPVTLLPDWIEWTSQVQPFTPTVDLLRNVLVGTPLDGSAWFDVLKVAGFAVVLMPLSVWVLRASVRATRRRGTILEY
jgi:ABC-2 type transport system permease protein